jgi:hypothetical protein
MRTRLGDKGGIGGAGRAGGVRRAMKVLAVVAVCFFQSRPAFPVNPAVPAQVPFEQAARDLASGDPATRLRAVQMLKDAAYPEAAVPLAAAVTDTVDDVQLEAIAAELNIFLAERVVTRKRVGLVIEKRNAVIAEPAFSLGPLAIGPRPVPIEVVTALRQAARDENPRVAIEALYAFGVLAIEPAGNARRDLLHASGPELAAMLGVADPAIRYGAARVIGRVFAQRPQDEPVEEIVGDAVISALNDGDRAVKVAAMQALGAMRYERGVQALADLFGYYGKGEPAAAALDALARIAHPTSAALMTAQLASKTAVLRGIAIEGIARLGDASKLTAVQAAGGSERSDGLILAIAFASAMLSNAPADPIVEGLTRPKLRDQAKQYCVELVPRRSALLPRPLQDPDARIRADVVDAIALSRDPSALPLVDKLTADSDARVAKAAERARAWLRSAGAKPVS